MLAQMRIVLVVTIIMLLGGTAVAEDFKFLNGGTKKAEIWSWLRKGVVVKINKDNKKLYYYVEIESIDGRAMEKLGMYKNFMVFLSDIKSWISPSHRKFRKRMQRYDQNHKLVDNPKNACRDATNGIVFKRYNKAGDLRSEVTCVRRKTKSVKTFYRNGQIKSIQYYQNNDIISVERYRRTGERHLLDTTTESR